MNTIYLTFPRQKKKKKTHQRSSCNDVLNPFKTLPFVYTYDDKRGGK